MPALCAYGLDYENSAQSRDWRRQFFISNGPDLIAHMTMRLLKSSKTKQLLVCYSDEYHIQAFKIQIVD